MSEVRARVFHPETFNVVKNRFSLRKVLNLINIHSQEKIFIGDCLSAQSRLISQISKKTNNRSSISRSHWCLTEPVLTENQYRDHHSWVGG